MGVAIAGLEGGAIRVSGMLRSAPTLPGDRTSVVLEAVGYLSPSGRPGRRVWPNPIIFRPMSTNGSDPGDEHDVHGTEDATLGGYIRVHKRPPAFEGADGQPYTVSIEVERVASLRAPWGAYLVFPKWAETGLGVVGHVETPILWEGRDEQEVIRLAGETPLPQVKALLDEAIRAREALETEAEGRDAG